MTPVSDFVATVAMLMQKILTAFNYRGWDVYLGQGECVKLILD
jgi:hypothetical protein